MDSYKEKEIIIGVKVSRKTFMDVVEVELGFKEW